MGSNIHKELERKFMNYATMSELKAMVGSSEADVIVMIEHLVPERAKKSLDAVDLTPYTDDPEIVKSLITRLSILRNELFRRGSYDFDILTLAEQTDNYIKRLHSSNSEWIQDVDVEIISETGSYVTWQWVFLAETAASSSIEKHAKVLADKYLLKPDSLVSNAERLERIEILKQMAENVRSNNE